MATKLLSGTSLPDVFQATDKLLKQRINVSGQDHGNVIQGINANASR
jgi:hypothetical protein